MNAMKPLIQLALVLTALIVAPEAFAQTTATERSQPLLALPATDDVLPGAGPVRRQDWFKKLWLERRSQWATQVERDQGAIVFLGDSITQGWGDDMRGSFAGVKVANRGISGDTTRGVLIRMDADVLALHPGAVVLLIGTNDLEDGADPEVVAGNLGRILAKLKQHNATMPIVLCKVFPSSSTKNRSAGQINRLNELYATAVKGDAQITVVDTWKLFANADGDATIAEFPDLLHPNAVGYAKWAAALRPILATLGFLDTDPDTFTPEAGYESLFNGEDLTGWGYRPTPEADIQSAKQWRASDPKAPEWQVITRAMDFSGQTACEDGRYVAKNGRLVVTTPAEGRKIQQLWTTREFPGNFILKLEFRATPDADSGIYIRGPQLQCRDYLLAGPYNQLDRYKPQNWNEIVVAVTNGVAYCTCNGEILETAFQVPDTGPIGLEGDRGQMEYRRLRLMQLP